MSTDTATETPPTASPAVPKSKSWCFTWNNYSEDWKDLMEGALIAVRAQKFVWQRKVGEEGTPHIQGCLQFTSQRTATAWQRTFNTALEDTLHYEVCRKWKDSCRYCCKKDSSVGRSFSNIREFVRIPPVDLWDDQRAAPWQNDIMALVDAQATDRTIYWYWEPDGGVGKSMLCRHLVITRGDDVFTVSGNSGDLMYGVMKRWEAQKEPKLIIWDLPRAQKVPDFSGLEAIKNGLFYSTKYESGQILLNTYPHVVVLSNHPPVLDRLSASRWKVIRIGGEAPAHHPIFVE